MITAPPNTESRLWGGLRERGLGKAATEGRPLISIITVVKNGAATFERTLHSVLTQTYAPLEYIVRDGASTDGTLDLLRRHEAQLDFWLSQSDGGLYEAMQQSLADARGDWLLFLGADDVLRPGFSSVAAQCCDPHTLYYGDVFLSGRRRRYAGPFSAAKLARQNICQQAIFYPRAVFAAGHSFNPRYRVLADWALNMQLWGDVRFRWQHVPEIVAEFNDRTGVSSRHADGAFARDYLKLVQANFSAPIYWWRRSLRLAAWPLRAAGLLR